MYIKMTFTYIVGHTKDLTLRDLCQIEENKEEKKKHMLATYFLHLDLSPCQHCALRARGLRDPLFWSSNSCKSKYTYTNTPREILIL